MIIPYHGPEKCDVLIVGGSPHPVDEIGGAPFCGREGDLLDSLVGISGIEKTKSIGMVYVIREFVEKVSQKHISDNKQSTFDEIKKRKPKYVIILGAVALKALLNKSKITEFNGDIVEVDGVTYMVSLSPSSVYHNPQKLEILEDTFRKFGLYINGTLPNNEEKLNFFIIKGAKSFDRAKKLLESEKLAVSYDIESCGLNINDPLNKINIIGFGVEGCQFILPLCHDKSPFKDQPNKQKRMMRGLCKAITENKNIKEVVAHNGKFDNKMTFTRYGVRFPQTFDTMLASHILDENTPNGLKDLAKRFLNAVNYALEDGGKNEKSLKKLSTYNAYDVLFTRDLAIIQLGLFEKEPRVEKVFRKITMRASRAYEKAELHGIYIDPVKYAEVKEKMKKNVDEALSDLNSMVKYEINWNSSQQVGRLLFERLKLPVLEYTETGAPSTSGETVLPRLIDHHPIIAKLLRYREEKKLMEFITSWGEKMVNNRIHPNFLIHGTVTGRPSCKEPNVQQVPRNAMIRSLISAPPGWSLVEIDYNQAELRIVAMVSGDPTMMKSFIKGIDIHRLTASNVMNVPMNEVTSEHRKKAKAVNFGYVYGMWAKKFRDYARDKYGVTLTMSEAEEIRNLYFETYSYLDKWHAKQKKIVKRDGFVESLIGRRRRLPDIESPVKGIRMEAERQSINSPVQGFGSDLNVYGFTNVSEQVDNSVCIGVGTIHDAILFEIKNEALANVIPELVDIMTDYELVEREFDTVLTVPIDVEAKVGSWGKGITVYDEKDGLYTDLLEKLSS